LGEFESKLGYEFEYEYATTEMFNYDDDAIDIEVSYDDGSHENMKLERALLSSDKTIEEIASEIS